MLYEVITSGEGNGHQDIGDARVDFFQGNHNGYSGHTIQERRPMSEIQSRVDDSKHRLIVMGCRIDVDAEEFRELRGSDNDRCGVGKAVDDRMGKKVDDQPSYNFV